MPLLPVALYGLEVPCGDIMVPAVPDFPATFRITMAAIDPTEAPQLQEGANASSIPRATLKIVRQPEGSEDDDEDEEYMRALLAGSDSESDDEEAEASDDEKNGGPSDPAKTKKAKKAAALKELMESLNAVSDEDMEGAPVVKASKKGKAKASEDDEEDSDEDSDVSEEIEVEEFVLCTLDTEKHYQQTLDITIGENERVFFKVTGTHTVYLTGNYVVPDDNGHNHHHEVYDSDDEEDEDYDLSPDEDELELEMDGDESDDLDDLENPRITEVDSEEEAPKLVAKTDKKGKNKRSADEIEEGNSLDDIMAKSLKSAADEEPKLSKKQLKKLKKNNGESAPAKSEETKKEDAKDGKGDKKVQFAKNLEQGPTGSAEKAKAKGEEASKPAAATTGVKVIQGVKIDDKKIGTGAAARKGQKVSMRYIGKLEDGKVFDSNKKGSPFSFKLGAGEVIQGWDIGVAGIQVGGERRLTIPSKLAYGAKGVPGIPGGATLVFDIKCLAIK